MLLTISIILNVVFLVVGAVVFFTTHSDKQEPVVARIRPTIHPALARTGTEQQPPASDQGKRIIERVKEGGDLREAFLSRLPAGERNKRSFHLLCRDYRDWINLSSRETSKALIYLRVEEKVIFTDGKNYWR